MDKYGNQGKYGSLGYKGEFREIILPVKPFLINQYVIPYTNGSSVSEIYTIPTTPNLSFSTDSWNKELVLHQYRTRIING